MIVAAVARRRGLGFIARLSGPPGAATGRSPDLEGARVTSSADGAKRGSAVTVTEAEAASHASSTDHWSASGCISQYCRIHSARDPRVMGPPQKAAHRGRPAPAPACPGGRAETRCRPTTPGGWRCPRASSARPATAAGSQLSPKVGLGASLGRLSGASSGSRGIPRDHEPHGVRVMKSERRSGGGVAERGRLVANPVDVGVHTPQRSPE